MHGITACAVPAILLDPLLELVATTLNGLFIAGPCDTDEDELLRLCEEEQICQGVLRLPLPPLIHQVENICAQSLQERLRNLASCVDWEESSKANIFAQNAIAVNVCEGYTSSNSTVSCKDPSVSDFKRITGQIIFYTSLS